jgi:hypothetical protein
MHLNKAAPMVPLILMDQALDMLPAYLNTYLKGPGTSAFFGQGLSPFIDDLRNIGIKSVFFPIMYAWKNHPGDMERLIHGLTVMAIRLRASDCARSQKGEVPGRRGASLNHAISSTFNKLAKSSAVTTFPFVETLLKECISCGYYSSDLEKNFTSNAANMQFKPNDGLLKVLKRLILHNETKLYALPPDQLNLEHVLPQNQDEFLTQPGSKLLADLAIMFC